MEGSAGPDDATGGEELYDLQQDPGEMNNLAFDAQYRDILLAHRALLQQHVRAQEDPFYSQQVMVDPRWRSHEHGYQHHSGPTAPMAFGK